MMTVIANLTLREGLEPEWDAAMRTRLESAGGRTGFLGNQLLVPLDGLNRRGPGDTTWFEVIERHPSAGLGQAAHAVVNRVREMASTLAAGESDLSKKHQ